MLANAQQIHTSGGFACTTRQPRGVALIVDMDAGVRNTANHMLQFHGYDVLEAENAADAMILFKQHHSRISVVLLDFRVLGMTIGETYNCFRALNSGVPIILWSGYDETYVGQHFNLRDMAGFVAKPFKASQLWQAIDNAVAQRSHRVAIAA